MYGRVRRITTLGLIDVLISLKYLVNLWAHFLFCPFLLNRLEERINQESMKE